MAEVSYLRQELQVVRSLIFLSAFCLDLILSTMISLLSISSFVILVTMFLPVESGIYKNRHKYGDPDRSSISLGSSSAANFSFGKSFD